MKLIRKALRPIKRLRAFSMRKVVYCLYPRWFPAKDHVRYFSLHTAK